MGILSPDLNHLGEVPGSAGPTSGFWDNFDSAAAVQYRVDSQFADRFELDELYKENLGKVAELTGEDIYPADLSVPAMLAAAAARKNNESPYSPLLPNSVTDGFLSRFDEIEKRLEAIRETNPDVRTFAEIDDAMRAKRKELIGEAERNAATRGVSGFLGGIAGGVYGSFSSRDPITVGSSIIGGFGRTLGMRILTEAGIAGAVEYGIQSTVVQPRRAAFGEPESSSLEAAAYAALGAGVIRGGLELAPAAARAAGGAYRQAEAAVFPGRSGRADARMIGEALEGAPNERLLLDYLGQQRQTPAVRAATYAIDAADTLARNNPYGASRAAQTRYEAELTDIINEINGNPSTAVSQVMDFDGPINLREASFEKAVVREVRPDIMENFDAATSRLLDAQARVDDLTAAIEGRTLANTFEDIDPSVAKRIGTIERELAKGDLPVKTRNKLEGELDEILANHDPAKLFQVENQRRQAMRGELGQARRAMKQARHESNFWDKEVADAAARIQRADALRTGAQSQLPVSRAGEAPEPMTVRAEAEQTRVAEATNQEAIDAIVARNIPEEPKARADGTTEPAEPPIVPKGKVDIGLSQYVDDDFMAPVDVDGSGNPVMRSARQIMDDIADDEAMVEAMRVCAI